MTEVRGATAADWSAIWPFFHQIAAAGETFTFDREIAEPQARIAWMLEPPGRTVVAVTAAGTVAGSAKMNPNQGGPGAHVASASFMVDPAHAGKGVGRTLAEHAVGWARDQGYRAMQFNAVVESNTRAVALWHSLGFQTLAIIPDAFDHPTDGYVGLHVMYLRL